LWQSDNDDDGNRGTRINFVMEFGNYGFKDQVTGAGWRTPRIGMHDEIPKRHWHLNDPGVIPNLLQTGSGSPTGMLVYEGNQLPSAFHHQMLHCEPGHNIVRAYPVEPKGAGYKANILPLVTSQDEWFRPSDVCVAPDGSVMIADWYDAGVGGHLMADIKRGRIYRIHGTGHEQYTVEAPDLSTSATAAQHLNHPNQETRYLAFQKVSQSLDAQQVLNDLIKQSNDSRLKARAYWCLASLPGDVKAVAQGALDEADPNLQMTGLRIARQFLSTADVLAVNEMALNRTDMQVLREAAISLRFISGTKANEQWVKLAKKYTGGDRWYLEALGIGADLYADARMTAYMRALEKSDLPGSQDIIWRSRSDLTLPHLFDLIQESETAEEMVRYFRAMHFLSPEETKRYLSQALAERKHPQQKAMARYALGSLSPKLLQDSREIRQRVDEILPDLRGTDMWTMVIRNAKLNKEIPALLDSALASTDQNFRNEAAGLVVEVGGHEMITKAYERAQADEKINILDLASRIRSEENRNWLFSILDDPENAVSLSREAAKALSKDWNGMGMLADRLESGAIEGVQADAIATFLTQASRNDVRQRAISWLSEKKGAAPIDLDALAEREGDPMTGRMVFDQYCMACHQVQGRGVNFGPNLSQIGDKLGPTGLLSAIVYPSQGIGFGFEGFNIETKDGTKYSGFIESQTELELTLRMMGGITHTLSLKEIVSQEPMGESLMTANLHQLMDEDELVDLMAYLSSLKAEDEGTPAD
ncbi:MAG: c-type cytochrome, partial [Saprospiraceae bacterium]|nr:c-type cytochrome [Saprospiraceae bacterium]